MSNVLKMFQHSSMFHLNVLNARFYTGLALLQQKEATVATEQEIILFLQQGLEYVMGRFFNLHSHQEYVKRELAIFICSKMF